MSGLARRSARLGRESRQAAQTFSELLRTNPQRAYGLLALARHEPRAVDRLVADVPVQESVLDAYITNPVDRWNLFKQAADTILHFADLKELNAVALAVFMVAPLPALQDFVASITTPIMARAALYMCTVDAWRGILAFLAKGGERKAVRGAVSNTVPTAGPSILRLSTTAPVAESSAAGAALPLPPDTHPGRASRDPHQPHPQTPPHRVALPLSSPGGSPLRRSRAAVHDAKMRDGQRCILSGLTDPEACHIFPFSGFTEGALANMDALLTFWGPEKQAQWLARCRDRGLTESAKNLLCLNQQLHDWWGKARFALKPVAWSDDPPRVVVQFYWTRQVRRDDGKPSYSPQLPVRGAYEEAVLGSLCGGATSDPAAWGDGMLAHRASGLPLRTGQLFTIGAEDKELLPDWELLQLQWALIRVGAMCGAGDVPDDYLDRGQTDEEAAALKAYQWEKFGWKLRLGSEDDESASEADVS